MVSSNKSFSCESTISAMSLYWTREQREGGREGGKEGRIERKGERKKGTKEKKENDSENSKNQ